MSGSYVCGPSSATAGVLSRIALYDVQGRLAVRRRELGIAYERVRSVCCAVDSALSWIAVRLDETE